ncbi:nitric oxide-associated protein 1 [Microcaecilia unicolor]|uniref:Nitric oxide-associated protein 1 n=1 Tax=Microcaecilia unicolor TaxID=1415580 RepID=A0A6P7XAT7_9AMPH|nr:nitric oxide-associated protein 1 [Microcaecilia unicolor]
MFLVRLRPALRHCPRLRLCGYFSTGAAAGQSREDEERRQRRGSTAFVQGLGEHYTAVEPGAREHFVFQEFVPEDAEQEEAAAFERLLQEERLQREKTTAGRRSTRADVCGKGRDGSLIDGVQLPPPGEEDATLVLGERCPGCGAVLQCLDPAEPGFVPRERVGGVCQRCFLLQHYQRALRLQLPPDRFRQVLRSLRSRPSPALVLLMIDLLDLPGSLFLPDLPELLSLGGSDRRPRALFLLGNKVDLLPADRPGHLRRLRERLLELSQAAGLPKPEDALLISAKTGYGVEGLISRLQRSWRYKGDVYLMGATNCGKSTLFNTLLLSDYCKSKAPEVIDRATISPWPGTTLNLLKFPIINPTPYRMFRRDKRLKEDEAKFEEDLSEEEKKHLNQLKKQGYLIERVGRTFQRAKKNVEKEIEFDADSLSFSMEDEGGDVCRAEPATTEERVEFTYNELKDAHWFYDTPGIVKEDCVLNLLNEKEVKMVLPLQAIIPRTFVLKPGMTLFLGALGRIDYVQGEKSAWFSVIASNSLPVHITSLEKADDVYQKHAGNTLLGVPLGGEERMKEFPPLVPQDITLEGIGTLEAVADIKLSTAGWVAVTAHSEDKLCLRGYTPKGTTLMIHQPPLLPYIVHVKGERIRKTPVYKTKRPPSLVNNLQSGESKQRLKKRKFTKHAA